MSEQPEGPEEKGAEPVEYILTQEQIDAIEHLTDHYAAMLVTTAMGARALPPGEHRDIMLEELKHLEEVLQTVARQLFPERAARADEAKQAFLKRSAGRRGLN